MVENKRNSASKSTAIQGVSQVLAVFGMVSLLENKIDLAPLFEHLLNAYKSVFHTVWSYLFYFSPIRPLPFLFDILTIVSMLSVSCRMLRSISLTSYRSTARFTVNS